MVKSQFAFVFDFFTFMIADDVVNGSVWEILFEQIVNSVHDSYVAFMSSFPDAVVNNVTGVVNNVNIWMSVSHSSDCIFDCDPWRVAPLLMSIKFI